VTQDRTQPRRPSESSARAETLGARARALEDVLASGTLLANEVGGGLPLAGKYVILGVPDDRGVANNGGHLGAAQGPAAFREAFYCLYDSPLREFCERTHRPYAPRERRGAGDAPAPRFLSDLVVDAGDIVLAPTIEETHERLATTVRDLLVLGAKRVHVLGGGHDFTYGSYKGHAAATTGLLPIVNLDAHFDLRPVIDGVINSGTPFSRILEDFPSRLAGGRALLELGIQRERNPHSLYEAAASLHVPTVEFLPLLGVWRRVEDGSETSPLNHVLDHLDDCRTAGWSRDAGRLHLSLDLDVFSSAVAPGTSASTPLGASLEQLGPVLSYLGRVAHCGVVDIAELCPPRDAANQTARLAAGLVLKLIILREEYASDKFTS
jgi:formiminoglutamase